MRAPKSTGPVLVMVLTLLLGACAHTGGMDERADVDPWEPFNRSMFEFNEKMDSAVIRPVAEGYRKILPAGIRKGVGNVFLNLGEPTTIVNDILQGKFNQAGHDFFRFVVNSTFGLLGWFDLATPMGLERNQEDFGQTLSVWGVPQGPYLVLPLLGGSTVIDAVGLIPASLYTDPRTMGGYTIETLAILSLNVVDTRARLLGASRVEELQLDPYVFRRETYLQRRMQLVYDGDPPPEYDSAEDDWDEDWEDLLDNEDQE
jgi:phospholipid-binding lipoprotein MlaA